MRTSEVLDWILILFLFIIAFLGEGYLFNISFFDILGFIAIITLLADGIISIIKKNTIMGILRLSFCIMLIILFIYNL